MGKPIKARRVLRSRDRQVKKAAEKVSTFTKTEQVQAANQKIFGTVEILAFESKRYGTCKVGTANHPLYVLRIIAENVFGETIHARRLLAYHKCFNSRRSLTVV